MSFWDQGTFQDFILLFSLLSPEFPHLNVGEPSWNISHYSYVKIPSVN